MCVCVCVCVCMHACVCGRVCEYVDMCTYGRGKKTLYHIIVLFFLTFRKLSACTAKCKLLAGKLSCLVPLQQSNALPIYCQV